MMTIMASEAESSERVMMASEMESSEREVGWEKLPVDIVHLVLEKLLPCSDYGRFALVCKTWLRAAVESYSQQPQRYKIYDRIPFLSKICLDFPPDDERTRFCGSSRGWLVSVDSVDNSIALFNPVQSKTIYLPPITYQNKSRVLRAVVSPLGETCFDGRGDPYNSVKETDPIDEDRYVVAAILECGGVLAYKRSDDDNWTYHPYSRPAPIHDIIFNKRAVIMVNSDAKIIMMFKFYGDPDLKPFYVDGYPRRQSRFGGDVVYFAYPTSSIQRQKEAMLLIVRFYSKCCTGRSECTTRTEKFTVYKVVDGMKWPLAWREVDSLGDDVVFVGKHETVCVEVSQVPGCKPNCIYFTEGFRAGSSLQLSSSSVTGDMGIFCLQDKSLRRCYEPPSSSSSSSQRQQGVSNNPIWTLLALPSFRSQLLHLHNMSETEKNN